MSWSNVLAGAVAGSCLIILAFVILVGGVAAPVWVWPVLIGVLALAVITRGGG